MLYIYPETVESVRKFVNKKWPDKNKEVYCQEMKVLGIRIGIY